MNSEKVEILLEFMDEILWLTYMSVFQLLSHDLTFVEQVRCLEHDLNSSMFAIRRLWEILPGKISVRSRKSIFYSKIRYRLALFGNERNPVINKIQKKQNDVIRMICRKNVSDRVSIPDLLSQAGFVRANQASIQHTLGECFKILNSDTNLNIKDRLVKSSKGERTETRQIAEYPMVQEDETWWIYPERSPNLNQLPSSIQDETKKWCLQKWLRTGQSICWCRNLTRI